MSTTRFIELIDHFARITDAECKEGVQRLGFTELERESHAFFSEFMQELGSKVFTDAVGNTIAELPGTENLPAIGIGSHLDSVYRAGRFDGIAGVVAGMLIAEKLAKAPKKTRHPFRFVVFATEEGARFGQACIGSRLIAGRTTVHDLRRLIDRDAISAYDSMKSVGLNPEDADSAKWNPEEWEAFLELHIEQGPALATDEKAIGIVNLISGSSRFELEFSGIASHSGGTPMHLRRDAFMGAAEFALFAEKLALGFQHHGTRVTIGKVFVEPGGITTIPDICRISVDVRDIDSIRQRETANDLLQKAAEISHQRGLKVEAKFLSDVSPAFLSARLGNAMKIACQRLGFGFKEMYSGASHDAQIVGSICETAMLFVPSQNGGVSHSPSELSFGQDLENGTEVLYEAALILDCE